MADQSEKRHKLGRRCKHCGRKLEEDEMFCWFCESEISDGDKK